MKISYSFFDYIYCLNIFRRALLLLRKKKFIEEKLKQADGQLNNVEQMIQDIEFAQVELKVILPKKIEF